MRVIDTKKSAYHYENFLKPICQYLKSKITMIQIDVMERL